LLTSRKTGRITCIYARKEVVYIWPNEVDRHTKSVRGRWLRNRNNRIKPNGLPPGRQAAHLKTNATQQRRWIMVVEEGKQVSIEYTLSIDDNDEADSNVGSDPLTYVQGAQHIVPGLEKALKGMQVGETKDVTIRPEDGFGDRSEDAFEEVDKSIVPEEARKVGAQLQGRDQNGGVVHARVTHVKEETIVLDLNHPLAGKTLHLNVKVLDIKEPVG